MMGTLYVFLLLCHFAFAVKHSLIYVLTATSGVPNFPEFAAAAMVDGIEVGHCDSELNTAEPKLDWMKKLVEDEPHHLQWYVRKVFWKPAGLQSHHGQFEATVKPD